MIDVPNSRATEVGLRNRADLDAVVYATAALVTAALIGFAHERLLSSTAWSYVLAHMPGGKPVLLAWILIAAIGMTIALRVRMKWAWWPYLLAGGWYMWVATFQLVCALSEPNGPLGFMGWGPYGVIILIHGLGQSKHLR